MKRTIEYVISMHGHTCRTQEVFADLVDAALIGFLKDPDTGRWGRETELLAILNKYPHGGALILELIETLDEQIRERKQRHQCIDILGEYYDVHIRPRNRQPLTSWRDCLEMAHAAAHTLYAFDPATVVEPACETGRILLSAMGLIGPHNIFFGIESDPIYAKIATLNLWSSGAVLGEILLARPPITAGVWESYAVLKFRRVS